MSFTPGNMSWDEHCYDTAVELQRLAKKPDDVAGLRSIIEKLQGMADHYESDPQAYKYARFDLGYGVPRVKKPDNLEPMEEARNMNNLEKLQLLKELTELRRDKMHINEEGEKNFMLQKPKGYYDKFSELTGDKKSRKGRKPETYDPKKDKVSQDKPWKLEEEAARSSEGAGSRTGMDENFGKSSQAKEERASTGDLQEGLDSYYKIAGL